jgi:hypothetical protein
MASRRLSGCCCRIVWRRRRYCPRTHCRSVRRYHVPGTSRLAATRTSADLWLRKTPIDLAGDQVERRAGVRGSDGLRLGRVVRQTRAHRVGVTHEPRECVRATRVCESSLAGALTEDRMVALATGNGANTAYAVTVPASVKVPLLGPVVELAHVVAENTTPARAHSRPARKIPFRDTGKTHIVDALR